MPSGIFERRKETLEELEERFWSKVDIKGGDECWEWNAGKDKDGYGLIKVNGKTRHANRIAWELDSGKKITKNKIVRHTCDNLPCCNPNHLRLGTWQSNSDDMVKKGRQVSPIGERNGQAKLTNKQVIEIRKILEN